MVENFHGSRVKIRRAAKHLTELNRWRRDFHLLSVDQDAERKNWVTLFFDPEALPAEDAAVMIGDVLDNLRSALENLWNDVILECGGKVTKYSRFPIRDTAEELEGPLANFLKKQQIEIEVKNLLLGRIKPYKAGNHPLWALDDLNIRDKHQLLIPVLKKMYIRGVSFEDEKGKELMLDGSLIADRPRNFPLQGVDGKSLRIKNKGYLTTGIFLGEGLPFTGQPVIRVLDRITKEVLRTVKAFETLLFGETG